MQRIGIGIVGLGLALKPHALALCDLAAEAEVIGGYSPSPGRRKAFEAAHGWPAVDTLEGLLADPRVHAILLLTPPRTHGVIARQAARAGKHVLQEKPLDVDHADAAALVADVAAAGVRHAVVLQHRFRPGVLALRPLLDTGALGDVVSASASIRWWRPPSYFAEPGRGMRARDAGGVLLTQAIHTLDLLLDLVGPVAEVSAFCRTSPLRAIDTEDVACGAVRYASGAIGVVDATTTAYPGYPERIEIAGTRGSAVLAGERLSVRRIDGPDLDVEGSSQGGGGADPMAFPHGPHKQLIEDFLAAIRERRAPRTDARSALPVHALIDAMLASSAGGIRFQVGA